MRIPILSKGTWLAAAVTIAIAAALLFAQQATADTGAGPPGAPANPLAHLIVPEGGDPRVRLSWDAPGAPVSGYTVARADGRSFQAAGTATTYSDHSVKPGTSYTYAVTARNGQGSGASSAPASASVPDAPSQPGELAAEVAKIAATDESASVALTWTAPTVPAAAQCETSYPLDGYTILRSSDGSQETEIATPGSEAVSITDDTAAFGATYTYRVFARSAIGDSPAAEATVTVPARPVLPATGLTASIADPFDGNVSLSWDAPAEGPPTVGYLVVRYLGADPYQGTDLPITLDELATQTTLVDETAQAGVTYSYLALARSADNVGEPSNAAVIEAPAPATGVTATADNGTVSLTWETPAMGTPGNYRIQRKATGGEWTQVAETMDTAHTDDNAPADSSYAYRVQHRNQYGGSAWAVSNQISLLGIPPRVTGVTATVSSNDIVVAWQALADGTADNYQVTYGIEDGQDRETATVPNTDTSFTHPDNTEGATYQYQVRAVNSAGEGPWSDPVTARRLNLPPGPTEASVTVSGADIIISWIAPETGIVDSYEIRYGVKDSEDTTTEGATETEFTHQSPDGDTTYSYEVRSKNEAGTSDWTNPVDAMRVLPPNQPTGVSTSKDDADIILNWNAPAAGIVDAYQVQHRQKLTEDWEDAEVDASVTTWTHDGPTPGTAYQYRVRTTNTAGVSEWTNPVEETWYRGAAPPTSIRSWSWSHNQIMVFWHPSATPETTGYEVEDTVDNGDPTVTSTSVARTFVNWNDQESQHEIRVRTVIDEQKGDWTPKFRLSIAQPNPVNRLRAYLEGRNKIRVKWNVPDTGQPDVYVISSSRDGAPSVGTTRKNGYTTTTVLDTFGESITYEITVRAQSHSGLISEAVDSATVSVTTEKAETVWYREPRALDTSPIDQRTVRLNWEAPESGASNITGYRVYRKPVSDSSTLGSSYRAHVLVSNTGTTATTYVDHAAEPGKRYQYGIAVRRDRTSTPVSGIATKAYGGGA